MLRNILFSSLSVIEGWTYVAKSLHLWAYSLNVFVAFFSIFWREIQSGADSIMYLYWTRKALAKSVHDRTFSRLSWLYHLVADPVKLSSKHWISSLSLLVWLVIFRQYMYRCANGHFVPSIRPSSLRGRTWFLRSKCKW